MNKVDPLANNPKVLCLKDAIAAREKLHRQEKSVVLTNGCFDLLHPGHLFFLSNAATLGDTLWIALNSEKSIKQLKGPTRPILNDAERAYALGMLPFVSAIIFFDTPRLTQEILSLKPNTYTKAGDYTINSLNPEELQALRSVGANIQFLPFLPGYSTTSLIKKINIAAQTGSAF